MMWIAGAIGLVLALGQVPDGSPAVSTACCSSCGVRSNAVLDLMVILQKARDWHRRERAAHDLRRVNWRCHPAVLGALSYSLLNDPDGEVREEVAESLGKMRSNDPSVYESLKRAAVADPYRPARRAAIRGVNALDLADRGLIPPNGLLAVTGRLMFLPARMIQQRVILPPGILRRPIVVPGVTIESAPRLAPETWIETPISPSPSPLEPIPSVKPDAPIGPADPNGEGEIKPRGTIDSKVAPPPADLAPLDDSEQVPAPPAADLIKPLSEKNDAAKTPKSSTTRRRVASYSGRSGQVPAFLPR